MPNPNGNPGLKKYEFEQKYNWSEPCSEGIYLRVPPAMKEAMNDLEISSEDIRQMISKHIRDEDEELFNKLIR